MVGERKREREREKESEGGVDKENTLDRDTKR